MGLARYRDAPFVDAVETQALSGLQPGCVPSPLLQLPECKSPQADYNHSITHNKAAAAHL